jgi:hypothetical protein
MKEYTVCVEEGYDDLYMMLVFALNQAQHGKGKVRHSNGLPFLDQPIMTETRLLGHGFAAGQARKKILEAFGCAENEPERAMEDLLGAIVYAAAMVIDIHERISTPAPPGWNVQPDKDTLENIINWLRN